MTTELETKLQWAEQEAKDLKQKYARPDLMPGDFVRWDREVWELLRPHEKHEGIWYLKDLDGGNDIAATVPEWEFEWVGRSSPYRDDARRGGRRNYARWSRTEIDESSVVDAIHEDGGGPSSIEEIRTIVASLGYGNLSPKRIRDLLRGLQAKGTVEQDRGLWVLTHEFLDKMTGDYTGDRMKRKDYLFGLFKKTVGIDKVQAELDKRRDAIDRELADIRSKRRAQTVHGVMSSFNLKELKVDPGSWIITSIRYTDPVMQDVQKYFFGLGKADVGIDKVQKELDRARDAIDREIADVRGKRRARAVFDLVDMFDLKSLDVDPGSWVISSINYAENGQRKEYGFEPGISDEQGKKIRQMLEASIEAHDEARDVFKKAWWQTRGTFLQRDFEGAEQALNRASHALDGIRGPMVRAGYKEDRE